MEDRLVDVFQKNVVEAYKDIDAFKKFARSKNGLCLDELDIQSIIENNISSVHEQKMQMLFKWQEKNGLEATIKRILFLVERYKKGDFPENYISLPGGIFGAFKDKPLCKQASVYLGEQKSEITGNHLRAIKFMIYDKDNIREAKILADLGRHENVVSIIHADIYKEGLLSEYIFMVMDLCDTKTLVVYFEECKEDDNSFDEVERWNMISQLLRGLHFIHESKVIHRDLKPHNILFSLDRKLLKLVDFGLSKVLTHGSVTKLSKANVGTDGYRSPETYNKEEISTKSDIYSCGVTIAEIFSNGRHPFGEEPDLWNFNIKTNQNLDLSHLLVSNKTDAENLIVQMLEFEPERRPAAEQLIINSDIMKTQLHQKTDDEDDTKHKIGTDSNTAAGTVQEANAIVMFNVQDEHLYFFKPSTAEWSLLPFAQEPDDFSTVVFKEYIYKLKEREVHRLNYRRSESRWNRKANMIDNHGTWPSAAVLNGAIYVCGRGNVIPVSSAEIYNISHNQWTKIENMKIGRKRPGMVAAYDKVYCIGGWDENYKKISSVERYSLKTGEWEDMNPTLRPTFKPSAVELNGVIYLADDIGVQCFDTHNLSWRTMNLEWPFRIEYTIKILVVDKTLYLVGYKQDLNRVIYKLDPETERMTLIYEVKDIFVHACVAVELLVD